MIKVGTEVVVHLPIIKIGKYQLTKPIKGILVDENKVLEYESGKNYEISHDQISPTDGFFNKRLRIEDFKSHEYGEIKVAMIELGTCKFQYKIYPVTFSEKSMQIFIHDGDEIFTHDINSDAYEIVNGSYIVFYMI